jgi:hypothetical protein
MKEKLDYNKDWSEYFSLDTDSPSGLVRIRDNRGKSVVKFNIGTMAYRENFEPRSWQLGFQEKIYQVHRIIWVLIHGSIDKDMVIDHLDGNPFNNSIQNLSLKTQSDNMRNTRKQLNNKTGTTGVRRVKSGSGYWYYEANWRDINGKPKSKNFSIAKLGEENARNSAIEYRKIQLQRLREEGAEYTERHGT